MNVLDIFEQIAESGHAPKYGCRLFSVGYEDALERIRVQYLESRFDRGLSAEKFVVGPFGSGKTHFLRHLAEIARDMNCVTSEVSLNKDLDPAAALPIYQEVVRQIQPPGDKEAAGIDALLTGCLNRVAEQAEQAGADVPEFQRAWMMAFDERGFALPAFGKIVKMALEAKLRGEDAVSEVAGRWLSGEISDRAVATACRVGVTPRQEHALAGRKLLLSLAQFIRRSGFQGTLLAFDEAEQGLDVDKRKLQKILSMFQSGINALQDLEKGSVLVVYAITPNIHQKMMDFAALQQRVADPGPGLGFFDGNTLAPSIDLTLRPEPQKELEQIARRLTDLFFAKVESAPMDRRDIAMARATQIGDEIAVSEPTSNARRLVAKRVCAELLVMRGGASGVPGAPRLKKAESEI